MASTCCASCVSVVVMEQKTTQSTRTDLTQSYDGWTVVRFESVVVVMNRPASVGPAAIPSIPLGVPLRLCRAFLLTAAKRADTKGSAVTETLKHR
jgi:hypothetical protein